MSKRFLSLMLTCVLCLLAAMPATASVSFWLLPTDESEMSSVSGEASIVEKGALHLVAPTAEGATLAIEVNETVHVDTVRYLQLCLSSTAPFNVALKMSGAQYDLFPQTAGPSWYEVFQDTAPAEGEGVKAGTYTVSLDISHYIKYNGIQLSQNGYASIKTVHISLRGAGEMTVHHLAVSDMGSFKAPNGMFGTTAPTKSPITTAAPKKDTTETTLEGQTTDPTAMATATGTTLPLELQTTRTYGSIATPQSLRDSGRNKISPYTWVFIIGGACLVASAVLPFMNRWLQASHKKKNEK